MTHSQGISTMQPLEYWTTILLYHSSLLFEHLTPPLNIDRAHLTGLQVWALTRAQFPKGGIPDIVEHRIFGFRWRLMARWKALLSFYNTVLFTLYVACILTVFWPLKVRY